MPTNTTCDICGNPANTLQGDVSILANLASTMIEFDPRFEIMPGTKARTDQVAKSDPYEAEPGAPMAE
jgi:hypothetical protein